MDIRFAASQAVEVTVPEQPIHITNYLRQPQRIVSAIGAASQIDPLSDDHYRLKMRPLNFMTLSIQPIVDLKVWADETAAINLQSIGCELRGIEYINQKFSLDLKGKLYPQQEYGLTYLKGRADLSVQVELPPPFTLTPRPILETAGNGLLLSVLAGVKQRLLNQLLQDYQQWVALQVMPKATSNVAINPSIL